MRSISDQFFSFSPMYGYCDNSFHYSLVVHVFRSFPSLSLDDNAFFPLYYVGGRGSLDQQGGSFSFLVVSLSFVPLILGVFAAVRACRRTDGSL